MNELEDTEWSNIGVKLTNHLGICSCQRKLKSIINVLVSIYNKVEGNSVEGLTGEEYLICALLENEDLLTHGTNAEYPIIQNEDFWKWVLEIKDSPYLNDN